MNRGPGGDKAALERNLRLFVRFRLFFNARFYYPVFTILFLDYGLSLGQFAILNAIWALTIVLAEVPSGALADLFGRRALLVFASVTMILEMAVLAFVPTGNALLLFLAFLFNRILSGLAEAAASGADEALAYDSLKALGRETQWSDLLEKTTRTLSVGLFAAMITGAFVYDAGALNAGLRFLGVEAALDPSLTIRFPLLLTLAGACIAFVTTLRMTEIDPEEEKKESAEGATGGALVRPFRQILAAARWTLDHRFVLFVILAALALDSVARQFVVLASEYYRTIHLSPAWFGIIGAAMSLLGIAGARLGNHLANRHSPFFNFCFLTTLLCGSLVGTSFTIPYFGVVFAAGSFVMMSLVGFLSSTYLNRHVDSRRRATVLSFRGLALNLGLGVASLLYTGWIAFLRSASAEELSAKALEELVFRQSLPALPAYLLFLFVLVLLLGRRLIRRSYICFQAGA